MLKHKQFAKPTTLAELEKSIERVLSKEYALFMLQDDTYVETWDLGKD